MTKTISTPIGTVGNNNPTAKRLGAKNPEPSAKNPQPPGTSVGLMNTPTAKLRKELGHGGMVDSPTTKRLDTPTTKRLDTPTAKGTKRLSPIDTHVGYKLREIRQIRGMTQIHLAGEIGITFQQIQKYEKGENRIGAGRLYDLSRIFDVSVEYFYRGYNGDTPVINNSPSPEDIKLQRDMEKLSHMFSNIRDGDIRKSIMGIVKGFVDRMDNVG